MKMHVEIPLFADYLKKTWDSVDPFSKDKKTYGQLSLNEMRKGGSYYASLLTRLFNSFPPHVAIDSFERELIDIKQEYQKTNPKDDLLDNLSFPPELQNRFDKLMLEFTAIACLALLDGKGRLKPEILTFLKQQHPTFDDWFLTIGEDKVTQAILESYFFNILVFNIAGLMQEKYDDELQSAEGFLLKHVVTKFQDDTRKYLDNRKSPSKFSQMVQNFNLMSLIEEIDKSAMQNYQKSWNAFEGVLTHPDYQNTIQGVFQEKFVDEDGELRTQVEDYVLPSQNKLVQDLIPQDYKNKVVANLQSYEEKLRTETYTDVEILDDSYGPKIATLKEKDRQIIRKGGQGSFDGFMNSYYVANQAHRLWLVERTPTAQTNISIQAFDDIYEVHNVLARFTEKLTSIEPITLGLSLLNRVRNLQNAWLSNKENEAVSLKKYEDSSFNEKIKTVFDTTTQNLQLEQGKLQQLIYFDKKNVAIQDLKQPVSDMHLVDRLTKVLNVEMSGIAFHNAESIIAERKFQLKTEQKKLIKPLYALINGAPNKTLAAEFQQLLDNLQAAPGLTPINALNHLINQIDEKKPNIFSALWNSFTSLFKEEVVGLEEMAWLDVLKERAENLKALYHQQYFDSDVIHAFRYFNTGRLNDVELLTTLEKIASRYVSILPARVAELQLLCDQLRKTIKQNDVYLETTVFDIQKNNKSFDDVYSTRSQVLKDHAETEKENYQQFFKSTKVKGNEKTFSIKERSLNTLFGVSRDRHENLIERDIQQAHDYINSLGS